MATDDARVPAGMPVLSRGKHRDPDRGACFMEYTALLAGEPFTDAPACVDEELATVLRGANDKLSDGERTLLVPLLGRAVGLTAGRRPPVRGAWWPAAARRQRRAQVLDYQSRALQLRRAAARRFVAAVGAPPPATTGLWSGCDEDVSWLFWDLMDQPTRLRAPGDYVRRLVERLHLLHTCYEQAMAELGLARGVPESPAVEPAR